MFRSAILTSLTFAATALPGLAAGADDAIASARNQLGVLEYCAEAGHIPASAAERQQAIFAKLPKPANPARVQDAYAKGQRGIVASMGIEQPITEAARLQGTDVAGLCRQMAAMSRG